MKRVRAIGLVVMIFLLVGLTGFLFLRGSILQWAFKREQAHLKTEYGLNLTAASIQFSSFTKVQVSNLCLQPDGADTLAFFNNLTVRPSLLSLLAGKLNLNGLDINKAYINVVNTGPGSNLAFLKRGTGSTAEKGERNLYARVKNLQDRFLKLSNTAFTISDLTLRYRDTAIAEDILIATAGYDGKKLDALFINQRAHDTLDVHADVIGRNKAYKCSIIHRGDSLVYLPFLDKEHSLMCRFKSLSIDIKLDDKSDAIIISPALVANSFHIKHWRLANDDVVFADAAFNGQVKISNTGFEVDSSSTIRLQHAVYKMYAGYTTQPDTFFALNFSMPETPSDTFFNVLPGGMFNTLKGIQCSGTLAYNLHFAIHTNQPDSLEFSSQLSRKNLRIIHYGADNYARINEPFEYDAYSGGQLMRRIEVGPENPMYTPLAHINPMLPAAIFQSEDPSFMQHRGFVPEAFRESVIQDFKEKRFARGGSTISMQLVKNIFLNRNKTVSRKAEEALVVYLVENLGLVPKERMLEVYLNVIEWGPNIYGATEAARFYFNKKPADLTLQECIFLAAIIPNPKYFKYQFDKQGEIKPYMADFFKLIASRMVLRGYLPERDTINFVPRVQLTGPALKFVVPTGSAPTDDDMQGDD